MRTITPETLLAFIEATEPLKHRKPIMYLISELRQFSLLLQQHAADFTSRGLSEEFLNCAELIANELEKRESCWVANRFTPNGDKAQWKKARKEALHLKERLIDQLELALFDDSTALEQLREIKMEKGDELLPFAIDKLTTLAANHAAKAAQVGLTKEQIEEYSTKSDTYVQLFAKADIAPDEVARVKQARDKARTIAEKYCSLIRYYADRIYRDAPETRKLFVSKYQSESNKRAYIRRKSAPENSFIIHES